MYEFYYFPYNLTTKAEVEPIRIWCLQIAGNFEVEIPLSTHLSVGLS